MNSQEYCDAFNHYQRTMLALRDHPATKDCKQVVGMVDIAKVHLNLLLLQQDPDINATSIDNPSSTALKGRDAENFADLFLQVFGPYLTPGFWREFTKKVGPLVKGPDIPNVPTAELHRRFKRIKPLIVRDGKLHTFDVHSDIVGRSYTWDPKNPVEDTVERTVIGEITTYHGYGYYGMFKPSVGEVLAQIPSNLLKKVTAFAIVKQPEERSDMFDGGEAYRALNMGYHMATTRLFGQAATAGAV